jgi:TP901 family phage tail tape measure protein
MTQFKLSGNQVPHVADLLAAAAGKAQGSVHDMGAALNQSGLVASQFGLSIEDTTGVLAEFASAGLMGSDAGTSLKTMLLALANPSKQSRDLMDELGISFYDATGKFIGMSGVAQVLQTRLKGLTQEQRNQALGQIFGNDAIRAASVLYTDGAAGVQKWATAVNDSGYASETAAKLTDNLAGDLERLKGSVETLAIEAGGGANGGLRILVKTLGALVDQFSALPPFVGSAITVLAGVSGVALLAGAAWIKTRKSAAAFRTELEAMGPAGTRAAAGMSKVSAAAGKVGVIFAVLETAGAVISEFQTKLNPQLMPSPPDSRTTRPAARWRASRPGCSATT